MRSLIKVLFAMCIATTCAEGVAGAQVFTDYMPPPKEMSDFVSAADAVVVVRIEAVRYESVPSRAAGRA